MEEGIAQAEKKAVVGQIKRPVEKTGQGDVTIPVPGDVVKIVILGERSCGYQKGTELHVVVMGSMREGRCGWQIATNVPDWDDRTEKFSLNSENGQWYTGFPSAVCSLEITHHVENLRPPRAYQPEVVVDL